MTRLEDTVKNFVDSGTGSFLNANNHEIVDTLEQIFQFSLPNSYRLLLSCYDFDPFSIADIDFYGSFELLENIQNDQAMFNGLVGARMMQIGKPDGGSYDPICIDGNAKRNSGELPLVRVCHESILLGAKAKILHTYTQDIPAMLNCAWK